MGTYGQSRRDFLKMTGLGTLGLTVPFLRAAPLGVGSPRSKPNILLIMADDVGREALGCYGGTSYKTPHLDALAASGVRFSHCYASPVCHPSRVKIMTGRYPFRNAADWGGWPKGVKTFGHVLRGGGYATAVAGKWQLALLRDQPDHARLLGFDEGALFGWHEGPRYHKPLIYRNGAIWKEVEKPEIFGPDVYAQFLIDFMTRQKNRPFFAYYSMALCHEISDDFLPISPPAPDGHYLTYREMIEAMDEMIGRLVAALERLKLRQETLILFTTDNGSPGSYLADVTERDGKIIRHREPVISMMNGRPVRGGKGTMTDAGTRMPLIANCPGTVPSGRAVHDLIDFSDFMPTLAELAGAALPEGVHIGGRSFTAQLRGQPGKPREWVYCEHGGQQWIRTKQWKLYGGGRLFDMQRDPMEEHPIRPDRQDARAAAAREKLERALVGLRSNDR